MHQDNIRFQSYIQNKSLCIVSLLREYIDRTSNLRGQETQLFISTQAPFKGVARATISRWVKRVMDKAGIDVKCLNLIAQGQQHHLMLRLSALPSV